MLVHGLYVNVYIMNNHVVLCCCISYECLHGCM